MHLSMPKPDAALRARLSGQVLDPRAGEDMVRGSSLEDGRAVGGRPRGASKRRAVNRRRAYGPKSYFDSQYSPTGRF